MHAVPPIREGYADLDGRRVWYGVAGEAEAPGRSPLVLLHGGPGAPHDHLEPLAALAADGRRVVFYDQCGCGESDGPGDEPLAVGLFVAELRALREALGLDRCHLLGQSWGGLLALEAALDDPSGLCSLVLADPLVSTQAWIAEADRLRLGLPREVQEALLRHEAAGTTDDPEYEEAMQVFYGRHLCRLDPLPECLQRTIAKVDERPEVYEEMWGPSEFHCTGSLAGWDVRPRLGALHLPALVLGGRHDECTPALQEDLHTRLPGSEWVVFEESSHMPHLEEPERFLAVVGDFISRVEQGVP